MKTFIPPIWKRLQNFSRSQARILASALLLLYSCSSLDEGARSYHDLVGFLQSYSASIEKEFGAELKMYSISYDDHSENPQVERITLAYSVDQEMKYLDGKALFYALADGFLERLNKNSSLNKYFHNQLASYADLYFVLSFDFDDQKPLMRDDVSRISIFENQITYFILNKDMPAREVKAVLSKPFSGGFTNNDMLGLQEYGDCVRTITHPLPENG